MSAERLHYAVQVTANATRPEGAQKVLDGVLAKHTGAKAEGVNWRSLGYLKMWILKAQ